MPADRAIQTQNLHKTFLKGTQQVKALQQINLAVDPGECVALMGHNGAGKSTLLRVLCGLILPDEGKASVFGEPCERRHLHIPPVGYMTPNERSFNWRLTGRQNLHYFGTLCGLSKKTRIERIDHWAKTFAVDYLDQRFDRYSTGMRQHLALVRVMLHQPSLLLLDEPARSLDAASCRRLMDAIRHLRDQGNTIVLATHLMPLAQELCTRVVTMHQGTIEQDRGKPTWDRDPVGHLLLTSLLSATEQDILKTLPEVHQIRTLEEQASELEITAATGALQTVLARCHNLGIHIWECRQGEQP